MPDRYVRPTGDMHIPQPRKLPPPIRFRPASIDGHPLPETAAYLLPEAPGLCYHASPGGCGRWTISHRASRCRVLDVVGPVSQVEAEMRRLGGLRLIDWTQPGYVVREQYRAIRRVSAANQAKAREEIKRGAPLLADGSDKYNTIVVP